MDIKETMAHLNAPYDAVQVVKDLLEYAVYDEERSDACIDAVTCARAYLEQEMTEQVVDKDGWIEWKGGKCPVASGTKVQPGFRPMNNRKIGYDKGIIVRGGDLRWSHQNNPGDIIAYRVVEDAK